MIAGVAVMMTALSGIGAPPSPAPQYRVVLEDPANDDRGPGQYIYPSDSVYRPGSFDLRRFEVRREADHLVFEVTFGANIRRPHQARRTHAREIDLDNGIYIQNVDIYIDTDGSPLTGTVEAIPGRNVQLDPSSGWDRVVVLSPLPFQVRSILDGWRWASRVITPTGIRALGPTATARVPIAEIGEPNDKWGFSVMVSGSLWEESFDAVGRLVGDHRKNALTIPVFTVAEDDVFGGGELAGSHPWVIDILTPKGRSQSKILSAHDAKAKRLAAVPMIYPYAAAKDRAAAAVAGAPTLAMPPNVNGAVGSVFVRVTDVREDMVVLERGEVEVKPFTLGTVLDEEGQAVAQVVVTAVYPKFILVTAVEGADAIAIGAAVRFNPTKETRK